MASKRPTDLDLDINEYKGERRLQLLVDHVLR